MAICDDIKNWLAEYGLKQGLDSLPTAAQRAHIDSCPRCQDFIHHLQQLDAQFDELVTYDAPVALLSKTKAAVAAAQATTPVSQHNYRRQRRWAAGLGAAALIFAVIGLDPIQHYQHFIPGEFSQTQLDAAPMPESLVTTSEAGADDNFRFAQDRLESNLPATATPPPAPERAKRENASSAGQTLANTELSSMDKDGPDKNGVISQPTEQPTSKLNFANQVGQVASISSRQAEQAADTSVFADSAEDVHGFKRDLIVDGKDEANESIVELVRQDAERRSEPVTMLAPAETRLSGQLGGRAIAKPDAKLNTLPRDEPSIALIIKSNTDSAGSDAALGDSVLDGRLSLSKAKESKNVIAESESIISQEAAQETDLASTGKKSSAEKVTETRPTPSPSPPPLSSSSLSLSIAENFLRQRETLNHLSFQAATGYWANTYLPGDPLLRRLQAQLTRWDHPSAPHLEQLEQLIINNRQPFDPPDNAALALYLHADKKALSGPSRLRLQVGLKGAIRQGGQRPALNIGVVLDLRGSNHTRLGPSIRAVLSALAQAKQAGDRFSLTVAGPSGGLILPPGQFRHGPLSVSLNRLLVDAQNNQQTQAMTLPAALELASAQVTADDDPSAPLGSSMVWLITTSPVAAELDQLAQIAHRNAIAGIQLSALTLGDHSDDEALQTLVLQGQGRLTTLTRPEQANKLIEQALYSASRAIARALRLRIRLAPGVQLIDILGSYRLDDPAAERVREAEQSIDQRLSRNLGIRADRGEDEEGIQILIPQFHTEAEHVILLDVVATQPGPIADVRLRYKDLVYARNNSASAQLSLAAGEQPNGPLERNVIKNQLSFMLTQALQQAANQLLQQQSQHALATLSQMQQLLQQLRQILPIWRNDSELLADEQLLRHYANVINNTPINNQQLNTLQGLAASLRYAAYRKLLGETLSE